MPKKSSKTLSTPKVFYRGHQKITVMTRKVGNKEIVWGCLVEDRKSVLRRILKQIGW